MSSPSSKQNFFQHIFYGGFLFYVYIGMWRKTFFRVMYVFFNVPVVFIFCVVIYIPTPR